MELITLFLHPFFIELSIYMPGRSGVAFPSYKQDFSGENFGDPRTLSGATLKAGSVRLNPTSSGCIRLSHHIVMHRRFF